MGTRKRDQVSDEEDAFESASDSNEQPKKAATSKAASGKGPSKARTTKKPKFDDADEHLVGGEGAVKVFKDAEGQRYVELGKKKRASVRSFKGQVFLDIREYYGAEGDEKPGKKGISLTIDQWETLKRSISVIDSSFAVQGKK